MLKTNQLLKILSLLFLSGLLAVFSSVHGQTPIGTWRHHLPNNTVVSLDASDNKIYAATPYGLLQYDKEFNSIEKIDKVGGLSDFGVNVIRYSHQEDLLMIGYENGNIDVLKNNQISSVSDIFQSGIIGSKKINNICFSEDRAFISTDFGIIVLDITRFVVLDTWFIGPGGSMLNVNEFLETDQYFYAATEAGLLKADVNAPNLADFQYWKPVASLPEGNYSNIIRHNNTLITRLSANNTDTIYTLTDSTWQVFEPVPGENFFNEINQVRSSEGQLIVGARGQVSIFDENLMLTQVITSYAGKGINALDALTDQDGTIWIADLGQGLIRFNRPDNFEIIIPEGPNTADSYGLANNQGILWVAPGSIINSWQGTFNDKGIFALQEGAWHVFNRWQYPLINELRDIHQITPHRENPARAYAAAWSGGLAEVDINEGIVELYDETNSTLQTRAGVGDVVKVGGSAYDSEGNLWVSNSDADHFLSVRQTNGEWISFPHNGLITGNQNLRTVVVDNSDQKWIAMPRGGGLMVFKEDDLENTNTFAVKKLTTQEGNGSLPSSITTTLAKDKDGYIWVGTNEGVVVFYSPQRVLTSSDVNAQSIIVVQDGFAGRLFENETINAIFVDGANNKWFGTRGSGAFLLSPDGRETLMHFTKDNSPLPSNNILDISADANTGEVFFATDQGLVSYRGFATEGRNFHSDVYAYPNPVRPGYEGFIAVKGLVSNARVKITDINGNLVYDDYAQGGQMVWDGKDLFGNKPASGVYLVFSTDAQGNETMVTKVMFLK
ncbi:MAG: two-component regulator propeller domain-containing protein [Bacteroidales bacterium]